jgi:hypothetical protein
MTDVADPELVSEVARGILADVAPDELPMFGMASEAFLKDPSRAAGRGNDDEMLGFGGGELELLTPVVLTVTSGVVSFLVTTLLTAAKAESQAIIQQRVRQLFKRFGSGDPSQPKPAGLALTREQLVEVRRVAFEIATRTGVTAAQAALVADSTVGQLVIAG